MFATSESTPTRKMTDRIRQIQRMLGEKGDDAFLIYSLGMEFASAGRLKEAAEQFRRCLQLNPEDLPAYAELGKVLRSAGLLDQARQTFVTGMDLAERTGQSHMRDFLQQQLDALGKGGQA